MLVTVLSARITLEATTFVARVDAARTWLLGTSTSAPMVIVGPRTVRFDVVALLVTKLVVVMELEAVIPKVLMELAWRFH